MSRIALGLAESVREWFAHAGGGTAVEIAPPVEATAVKTKRVTRKKKVETAIEEPPPEAPVMEEPVTMKKPAKEIAAPAPIAEAPPVPIQPAPTAAPVAPAPAPIAPAPKIVPTPVSPKVPA